MDQLLEASFQATGDTIAVSVGDSASLADTEVKHEGDTQMTNGVAQNSGHSDVEMQDVDAPGEEVGTENAASTTALIEVDANISQTKPDTVNGTKDSKQSGANGDESSVQNNNPPTPPLSNGDITVDRADPLTSGGIPWYLKDFDPEGTIISQEQWTGREAISRLSEDLSDMDDDELKGLGLGLEVAGEGDADIVVAPPTVTKPKKARPKRSRKGGRR